MEKALTNIDFYTSHIAVIFPKWTTLTTLKRLLGQKPAIKGKIFDLYLVAAALDNGINHICTWNTSDFKGLSEVEVFTPTDILEKLIPEK